MDSLTLTIQIFFYLCLAAIIALTLFIALAVPTAILVGNISRKGIRYGNTEPQQPDAAWVVTMDNHPINGGRFTRQVHAASIEEAISKSREFYPSALFITAGKTT
jgi:hypothetical protein